MINLVHTIFGAVMRFSPCGNFSVKTFTMHDTFAGENICQLLAMKTIYSSKS